MAPELLAVMLFALIAAAGAGFLSGRLLLVRAERIQRQRQLLQRLGLGQAEASGTAARPQREGLCSIGLALAPRRAQELERARQRLGVAGLPPDDYLGVYYCIKHLGALLLLPLAFTVWQFGNLPAWQALALPLLPLYLPELFLRVRAGRRLQQINAALPDFIDMCNICMSAGLGWLGSVQRVAQELAPVHPALAREFLYLLEQIQAGMTRGDALKLLARRNPTRDVQHLVQVLLQNERQGSPVLASLSDFSRRIYQERQHHMEEKAGKLAAKMALIIAPFLLFPFVLLLVGEQIAMLLRNF